MINNTENAYDKSETAGDSKGRLFILSAPSGAGKTTLCNAIRQRFRDIVYSVSFTTRAPRKNETEGADYHFVSREEFNKMIAADKMAEWAQVHGNYYGTSAEWLNDRLNNGKDILLDIDVEGTSQILEKFPDSITIFIMPPSMEELRRRLQSRESNDPEDMERRISNAQKEIARRDLYDHIIVNDRLEDAIEQIVALIQSYRKSRSLK